jgi:hypothetical protein
MRGPKELNNLQKELNSMTEGNKEAQEKQWQATLEFLNNPNGFFNRDGAPLPKVKDKDGQK